MFRLSLKLAWLTAYCHLMFLTIDHQYSCRYKNSNLEEYVKRSVDTNTPLTIRATCHRLRILSHSSTKLESTLRIMAPSHSITPSRSLSTASAGTVCINAL